MSPLWEVPLQTSSSPQLAPITYPVSTPKGLIQADTEGPHSPLHPVTLTHPDHLRGPPPISPPTRVRGPLPAVQGRRPPAKLECLSAPARVRPAEQVTDYCGPGERRSAGRGWAQRRRAEGRRRAPPAGQPGRLGGLGALAAAGGPSGGRGAGTCEPRGPRPTRRRVCKLKPSGASERGPALAVLPSDRLRTGGPEGGGELNENFRFSLQLL